ncbi:FadR/GntR family transcriptional regulator [Enterobacillus tribolii]|uniref:GntR family transcriptional regulator n=1 Tax=Enterobacillus tribolii TaxID=1487935 RepID=A0A370R269_9GAMM|nr:FadR/GntR family transcriptional regulator [Enterobacillus tribolii]MBW7984815.1 FadR family transcriptional regulator [Enterobacillus tribolii]RDK96007.1 GntR family transcriptional regulator [Enterobacillus tribolii]
MKQPQTTLAESVTQHIACRILHGDLIPGLALPGENELATEYSVSRTSIRNALQFLAAKGLISIQAKKRTTINKREQWNLLDADVLGWLAKGKVDQQLVEQLMVTRLIFEPNIATLAALNATGHDLAAMEDALQLMRQGQHTAQADTFEQGDLAFHHALLRATHNPFLQSLGNALSSAMALSFQQTLEEDVRQTRDAVDEHSLLLEAVRLKQPERARQQMRTILLNAARKHIWQDQPELLNLIV